MKDSIILEKTLDFSVRIVNLCKYLSSKKHEHIMSRQLVRSGTSIGANAHVAHCGQSNKDFLAKMYVALKEASETEYWLQLLFRTGYLTKRQYDSILADCVELKKILTAIIITLRNNMQSKK
jgi:four helix bundle protein